MSDFCGPDGHAFRFGYCVCGAVQPLPQPGVNDLVLLPAAVPPGRIVKIYFPANRAEQLRPPPEYEGKPFHWVETNDHTLPLVVKWEPCGGADLPWLVPGVDAAQALRGYRYRGPAEWSPVASDVVKRLEAENASLRAAVKQLADRLIAPAAVSHETPAAFPPNALKHSR